MVEPRLVNDVRKVLEDLRATRGEFTLAMLYNGSEEGSAFWFLIVSAPWLSELPHLDAIGVVADALRAGLSPETMPLINAVLVLDESDKFVDEITQAHQLSSPGSRVDLSNVRYGYKDVPRGVLFYSNRHISAVSR